MSKKKDMWKLAQLGKSIEKWAPSGKPIKKAFALPAAPAAPGGKPKDNKPKEAKVESPKMPKPTAKDYGVMGADAMRSLSGAKVSTKLEDAKHQDLSAFGYKKPGVKKAELGGPKETDWSKPDGAPVDILDAVQRPTRAKAMESQGQKKEVAVFSEAQKRHMKDGGFPVEKSDPFNGWQPARIGRPEPLAKKRK